MRTILKFTFIAAIALSLLSVADPSWAQFGKLKDKVKKKAEQKTEKKVDKEIDDAMDDVLDGDVLKGDGEAKDSEPAAEEAGGEASNSEASPATATASSGQSSSKLAKPGTGAWLNYDFVPGDRVIFYEDFRDDYVGDFPMRLTFVKGNMEVAEWEGDQYLRIPGAGQFDIALKSPLPEKYTLELGLHMADGQDFYIYACEDGFKKSQAHAQENINIHRSSKGRTTIRVNRHGEGRITEDEFVRHGVFDLRLMVSGSYLKVYIDETRVANIPNSQFARETQIRFHSYYNNREPILIRDIRLAEGGRQILYRKLEADGRVATHGILFDSGSDVIRPESTPTLKEIGKMLQQHEDLSLLIEGHTDSQGDDSFNQDLSDKRAAAVKVYICSEYGVTDSRLTTKGFGESKPVDSNDTPEGRQNNRRVELVKL